MGANLDALASLSCYSRSGSGGSCGGNRSSSRCLSFLSVASLDLLAPDEGGNESDDGGQDETAKEASPARAGGGANRGEADVASSTQSNCLHVQDGSNHCTNTSGNDCNVEGPAQSQVHTEHCGLGNTQECGGCGCRSNALDLLVLGGQRDTGCGSTLSHVRHGGNNEDEGTAGCPQAHLDGRECLVHTGHHDECVEGTEDQTTQRAGNGVEPVDTFTQPGTQLEHRRADQQEGQEAGDEDGEGRGEDEVDGALEDLVEELLNVRQDKCNQHDGQHGTLVARLLNLQAEEVPVGHGVSTLNACQRLCDAVAVHQGRGDHCGTHGHAQVGVTTEDLGGGETNQHGQEGEGRCGEQVHDIREALPLGVHLNEGLRAEDTLRGQHAVDRHQHTATDQHRDERHEDVGNGLDEAGDKVALLRGDALEVVLGCLGCASGDEVLVYLVDVAGADDDLELASVEEATLEILVVVDCCLVDLVLVLQDEAKAGCAVCGCNDVAGATDVLQHALCH